MVDRSPLSSKWEPTTSESLAFSLTRDPLELGWLWDLRDNQMRLSPHYYSLDFQILGRLRYLLFDMVPEQEVQKGDR
jgi:hypothetical protein